MLEPDLFKRMDILKKHADDSFRNLLTMHKEFPLKNEALLQGGEIKLGEPLPIKDNLLMQENCLAKAKGIFPSHENVAPKKLEVGRKSVLDCHENKDIHKISL